MATKPRCLWLGGMPIPQRVRDAAREIGEVTPYCADEPLANQLSDTALAVVCPSEDSDGAQQLGEVLTELEQNNAVAVFLLPKDAEISRRILSRRQGQFLCAAEDAPTEKLASQFAAAAAIQPVIRKLHAELSDARNVSAKAARTIEEMDEEMRLAARLQRDFLPRRLPEVGRTRFGVLYQPASWVSGDIYDVVRLDETNVGFYVADVVGHGMPAALLTMFIKKAFQTKRIVGHTYEIVPPHISLKELNIDICEQELPSCQFCTAVYCVVETTNLTLTYARGGHPEPAVIHPDGKVDRLWVEGSLLGILPAEQYTCAKYQLKPGDRLLLYTDGAEEDLCRQADGQVLPLEEGFSRWANVSREEMLLQLAVNLESRQETDRQKDDVTVLVMDIEE